MRYDVIVVGGGPAGSTAARECAEKGLSVALLDKAEFPRDKPCGGGVNVRAAKLLPFDIGPVTERVIFGMRITARQSHPFVRYSPEPLSFLTQRRALDAFLVDRARAAGVTFMERAVPRAVERGRRNAVVRSERRVLEARVVVAADGANGCTATLAGIQTRLRRGIALEGNVTPQGNFPSQWADVFGVDVGTVRGGYGWLFPKGDHVNIGLGGEWSVGPILRRQLEQLTRFYGFQPKDLWGVRGHPLTVRRSTSAMVDGNVILVGDAAGFLDSLSGEGIFAAIRSGQIAARHIVSYLSSEASNLSGYREELERDLLPELEMSNRLHDVFRQFPTVWATLLRWSPSAWRFGCGLITGEVTYDAARRRVPAFTPAINLASGAARLTGRFSRNVKSAD